MIYAGFLDVSPDDFHHEQRLVLAEKIAGPGGHLVVGYDICRVYAFELVPTALWFVTIGFC